MDYLYKLTVEIDDDKVLRLQRHDLGAVYQTVRDTFAECNFQEQSQDDRELIFTIGEGKDSFSEVGIVTNSLYDSWLGPYLKRMEWYDASDDSTEDVLREIGEFEEEYGEDARDFNWKFPEGIKYTGRSLREVCESAQEDFYKANGYYPTTEEAVRLTDEARKEIACEKKQVKEIADQAVREKKQDGKVTVLCPKCKNAPKVILNGNRTLVKCACGYICDAEIYL